MVLVSGNLAQELSIRYFLPLHGGSILNIFFYLFVCLQCKDLFSVIFLADYFGKLCLPWSNVDWY